MKTKISSVSKKEEQLLDISAAVYVVTREEIRSSGARNIPDALRLVPGMDVNQINASTFDVGIRGFDERFSNKILVMVDGRSLYSPIFGGIYWDSINLVWDDIEISSSIRKTAFRGVPVEIADIANVEHGMETNLPLKRKIDRISPLRRRGLLEVSAARG